MSKRITRPARTMIIKHTDGYHICFSRDNGYSALIDSPYFSAVCLGYFKSETEAQSAIDAYRYEEIELTATATALDGGRAVWV